MCVRDSMWVLEVHVGCVLEIDGGANFDNGMGVDNYTGDEDTLAFLGSLSCTSEKLTERNA